MLEASAIVHVWSGLTFCLLCYRKASWGSLYHGRCYLIPIAGYMSMSSIIANLLTVHNLSLGKFCCFCVHKKLLWILSSEYVKKIWSFHEDYIQIHEVYTAGGITSQLHLEKTNVNRSKESGETARCCKNIARRTLQWMRTREE